MEDSKVRVTPHDIKAVRDWLRKGGAHHEALERVLDAAAKFASLDDEQFSACQAHMTARTFLASIMENKNVSMAERLHAAALLLK